MESRIRIALGLCAAALILAGTAWAQGAPTPPRIDPGTPPIETGPDVTWMFVPIPGVAGPSTAGQLTVRRNGDLLVWSIRRVAPPTSPEGAGGVSPRRTDPGDPPIPGEGGPPPAGSPPGTGEGGVTPYRTDPGEVPEFGGGPVVPAPLLTISTLYLKSGPRWSPALEVSGESGAYVFESVHGDLYANTDLPDGRIGVYRLHDGVWQAERLPEGTRGPAGAFAGENLVYMRAGGEILRHTGNHWKVEFNCAEMVESGGLVYLGRNQMMAFCTGHEHVFDGQGWVENDEALPTHVRTAWAGRDAGGTLHLFAGGFSPAHTQMEILDFVESQSGTLLGQFHRDVAEPPVPRAGDTGVANAAWGRQVHDVYVTGLAHGVGHLYHFNGTRWANVIPQDVLPATIGVGGTDEGELWVSLADGRLLHRARFPAPASEPVAPLGPPVPVLRDPGDLRVPTMNTLRVRSGPAALAMLDFTLAEPRDVSVEVFDLAGRRVADFSLGRLAAGEHRTVWNGSGFPSGLYLCRVQAGSTRLTGRILLYR